MEVAWFFFGIDAYPILENGPRLLFLINYCA
jgi:hypothetical protein